MTVGGIKRNLYRAFERKLSIKNFINFSSGDTIATKWTLMTLIYRLFGTGLTKKMTTWKTNFFIATFETNTTI